MNVLLNLLKAFGIVVWAYLLLAAGIWTMLSLRFGYLFWKEVRMTSSGTMSPQSSILAVIILIFIPSLIAAFGALYLPQKGRLVAGFGVLALILGIWTFLGIQLLNGPHN